jgi:cyclohexanecarboxylate-CoA ligase
MSQYRGQLRQYREQLRRVSSGATVAAGSSSDGREERCMAGPERTQSLDAAFPGRATSAAELVRRWAASKPDELAVIDLSRPAARTLTWRQLSEQANRIALLLARLGVQPGDVVAMKLPNWRESVVAALGIVSAGALACPLLPDLGRRETQLALSGAAVRVLIAPAPCGPIDAPARSPLRHLVLVDRDGDRAVVDGPPGSLGVHMFSAALAAGDAAACPPADADCGGQLGFTSGTSGQAKCVLHNAEVLTRAARLAAGRLGIRQRDRIFMACPLAHHSGFLYGMWLAWVTGCTQIMQGRWEGRRAVANLAASQGTVVQLAPAMLIDLVRAVEHGAPPLSLRAVVVTGAPVADRLGERASRVLGAAICRAWGSTETCMGTLGDPADTPGRLHQSDGRPLDGVRLRVVGSEGELLGPGQEGNLLVSSPCLFGGYGPGQPLDRAAFTADGWYRTGDLATIDESGYLRVTGRTSDVINRGGLKIPAALVETMLSKHRALADVAIVAVPDARLGERACAVVVLAAGERVSLADLQRHLEARGVTRHYWPEQLEFVDALPRNAAGKVVKSRLRPVAQRRTTSDIARGQFADA